MSAGVMALCVLVVVDGCCMCVLSSSLCMAGVDSTFAELMSERRVGPCVVGRVEEGAVGAFMTFLELALGSLVVGRGGGSGWGVYEFMLYSS